MGVSISFFRSMRKFLRVTCDNVTTKNINKINAEGPVRGPSASRVNWDVVSVW